MSSIYVRNEIKTFIATNSPSETLIDMTAQYSEVDEIIEANGLTHSDPWLGIQFIGQSESPIEVGANNTSGFYREEGLLFFHIVERVCPTVADKILARVELLRDSLRGQRINDIVIESVSPPSFEAGGTLEFEGGYQSASITVDFYRDLHL